MTFKVKSTVIMLCMLMQGVSAAFLGPWLAEIKDPTLEKLLHLTESFHANTLNFQSRELTLREVPEAGEVWKHFFNKQIPSIAEQGRG